MKTRHITLIVAFLFIAFQTIGAKPKVLLRLNLEKDAQYQMTMTSDNSIDQEMNGQQIKVQQKMIMGMAYKVLDVLPDKNYVIEYSINKMKMDMEVNGQKMTIDSEGTDDDPNTKNIKDITAAKLKLTITPQGKVLSVEGIEEYMSKINSNPQMAQALTMFANEDNFKSSFGQYFSVYPDNEVEVGNKWDIPLKMPAMMNMEMNMHYNVKDISDDQIVLGVNSEVNMDSPIKNNGMEIQMKAIGTQTGTMKVDRKSGMAGTADINQKFDMNMKFKNPQSGEDMEIPMIMNAVTKISVVKI